MGLGEQGRRSFARSGRAMLPEELSAEVLKSLTADVRAATNEEIHAAVITVPAAFDAPQTEATRKAGQLAGLAVSPLLQEPIAAALCYGFQQQADKVFWLVYDFGGGTFDAAIIQVREGVIHVVNHAGDNFLGGKNIDWDIVNRLLVPVLTRRFRLPEFQRGNVRWRTAFAKLKPLRVRHRAPRPHRPPARDPALTLPLHRRHGHQQPAPHPQHRRSHGQQPDGPVPRERHGPAREEPAHPPHRLRRPVRPRR